MSEDKTVAEQMKEYHDHQDRQDALEHHNVHLAIRAILQTPEGITLFSYLYKNLDVMCVPEDKQGDELHQYLGHLRAGNSIFKLASEANSEQSAKILANLERKRNDDRHEWYRIENGLK